MDDHATHDEGKRDARATVTEDRPRLVAEILSSECRPAECTLFPPDLTGFERTTTWMTAEEGSFVALAEMA